MTSTFQTLALVNERKLVIPTVTITAEATLRWQGRTVTLAAGTHRIADIELQAGVNLLEVRATGGSGKITVTYQEGAL